MFMPRFTKNFHDHLTLVEEKYRTDIVANSGQEQFDGLRLLHYQKLIYFYFVWIFMEPKILETWIWNPEFLIGFWDQTLKFPLKLWLCKNNYTRSVREKIINLFEYSTSSLSEDLIPRFKLYESYIWRH